MDKVLIDTQIIIWFLEQPKAIPNTILMAVRNPANTVYYSQISLVEIGIKTKIGKLKLSVTLPELILELKMEGILPIPLSDDHICKCLELPLYEEHRDPFDRLLAATAWFEDYSFATTDQSFQLYKDLIRLT